MDLVPYNMENIFEMFPPQLQNNFRELFDNGKIGLCPVLLNDISTTKQYTEKNCIYGYYYTLRIPYAGKRLNWELIFDPTDICFAPDFNFNDDTFYMSTDIVTVLENIPSLDNWNVNNPKSLILILKEFLDLYKKQQLKKLDQDKTYEQLNSDYQALAEVVSPNDIEIYLESTSVHFLININVDTSTLPEYLQSTVNGHDKEVLDPGNDACILKISFLKLDYSRVNCSLQLSPGIDQILGTTKNLHVPKYNKAHTLADYVNSVSQMLQDHVTKIKDHQKLKKEYIMYMALLCAQNITEYDSETFSKATFLCEDDGYECLVTVELGDLFPEVKPTVTLHSLYCIPQKKKCSETLYYLYDPSWSVYNMLQNLMRSLAEKIPKFKNHKHY